MDDDRSPFSGLKSFWRKRKHESLRSTMWAQARKESEHRGRREVWIADVVAMLLQDASVKAALSAIGEDPEERLAATRRFQTSEEQPDVASRSGTFQIGEDIHTWPLDRAVDRANALCQGSRAGARKARPVDVLVACLTPTERDLVGPIFSDFEELRVGLQWHLAHGDAPRIPLPPETPRCRLVLHDDDYTSDEALALLLENALGYTPDRARAAVADLRRDRTLVLMEASTDEARQALEQIDYVRTQAHLPVRADMVAVVEE